MTKRSHAAPAEAFRKEAHDGALYTLPGCGLVARLRRPALHAMAAAAGRIPNPLRREVLRFMASTDSNANTSDDARIAAYEANTAAIIQIAALALVEPKLVLDRDPDYANGEIGPLDLSDTDYNWLYYQFVEGGAAGVALFRVKDDDPGTTDD